MDTILHIIFLFLLILTVLRVLGDPDWMPFLLRVGVPIYRKRFSVRSNASLSSYFQEVKKQISIPRIEFKRFGSNAYFVIIYQYPTRRGRVQYLRPMVPVRFGIVRYDKHLETINFTGYLDFFYLTFILGFWLLASAAKGGAFSNPAMIGIGILAISILIDLARSYRFINKFLREAICAVERKNR